LWGERMLSLRFAPPRLALCLATVRASRSSPLVDQSAYLQRKKYPVGCWSCISLSVSRPRMPVNSLSLLPFAIVILFRVAISYSPRRFGSLAIAPLVYLFHVVQRAIPSSLFAIDATHRLAYPLAKSLEGIANGGMGKASNHGGS
jgi:hypothetical protein